MSTLDRLTNNFRDTVDYLADGWQELWNRARNAITHFTPQTDTADNPANSSRWGVLSAELRETENEAKATYTRGVLELVLPKHKALQPRKITVG